MPSVGAVRNYLRDIRNPTIVRSFRTVSDEIPL